VHARPPLPPLFGLAIPRTPELDNSTDEDSPLTPLYPKSVVPESPELRIYPYALDGFPFLTPFLTPGLAPDQDEPPSPDTPILTVPLPTPELSPPPSPTSTRVNTPPTPAKILDSPMNQAQGFPPSETAPLTHDPNVMQRYDVQHFRDQAAHPRSRAGNILLYILAIFLPPVPVFLKAGCGCEVLVNILVSYSGVDEVADVSFGRSVGSLACCTRCTSLRRVRSFCSLFR
jgi:uncharacterized membrane protein YqaE (UPF0057 family)